MLNVGLSRRSFLKVHVAGAAVAGIASLALPRFAYADPLADDAQWIANHLETRLLGADGQPVVGLPRWTRMRVMRGFSNGFIEVWVPTFGLVGRVPATAIGPVPTPSAADLRDEQLDG